LRVIFIAGHGRSGSTILDALLAQSAGVTGTGELVNLVSGGLESGEFCACGNAVRECEFWSEVGSKWSEICGSKAVAGFRELNASLHRRRSPWNRRTIAGQRGNAAQLDLGLFQAIAETCGDSTLIDSSKVPARLDALARIDGLDLRVIHLIRDPSSVAKSLSRPLSKNRSMGVQVDLPARRQLRSAAAWAVKNLSTERIIRRHGLRSCRVRFEDLTSNPEETLNRIAAATDMDLSGSIEVVRSGAPITFGHTVAGNRVRMQGPVRLLHKSPKPEDAENRLGAGSALITAPLARRYGY